MHLTQSETRVFEIIRITGRSRVTNVGELSLVALRTHSEKFGRYGRIKNKVSVEQPILWIGIFGSSCEEMPEIVLTRLS